jgi:hypothetical protein
METTARGRPSRGRDTTWDRRQPLRAVTAIWLCPDERVQIRVARPRKQFGGEALLYDLPGVHDRYSVSHFRHDPEVVRDEEDAQSKLIFHRIKQVEYLGLHRYIERRRWFVGYEELGITTQGDGHHDALCHTTRELMWVVREPLVGPGNPYASQQVDAQEPSLTPPDAPMGPDRFD